MKVTMKMSSFIKISAPRSGEVSLNRTRRLGFDKINFDKCFFCAVQYGTVSQAPIYGQ
jgi:hypothetical protein